jgi:hypothetical protein
MDSIVHSRPRTALIIASLHIDTADVSRSLLARNIETVRVNSYLFDSTEGLKETLRKCDFVCVYSPAGWSPNMFFELGLAIGLGKRYRGVETALVAIYSVSFGQTLEVRFSVGLNEEAVWRTR